jgi:hypothetical protein
MKTPCGIASAGGSEKFRLRLAQDYFAIAIPILMTLSAMTPSPTHRAIPAAPWYRERVNPCRRFRTLILPSHPVLHF